MSPHSVLCLETGFSSSPGEDAGRQSSAAWRAEVLNRLGQWFSTDFQLLSAESEPTPQRAGPASGRDWESLAPLCRAVAESGRAAFVDEEPPLITLALPVPNGQGDNLAAVATFVTGQPASSAQLARSAEQLGMETDAAARWMRRQVCWVPEMLLRMGQLACVQLAAEQRLRALEHEVRDLSLHLSSSYEEISLLYRLTQNLKLSSKDEELVKLALDWLADVLPVESLGVQLTPVDRAVEQDQQPPPPELYTRGNFPLTQAELSEVIEYFHLRPGQKPLVVNRPTTERENWPWPAIRELVIVPLTEGDHCFGWIVACNHQHGAEVGTVEAGLLSSVAAILGIHSGNAELYQQQREFFAGVVRALTSAIDAKDPYTCGHSDRVARVAVRLAEELGCDAKQLDTVYLSGLLHDVGKIGIDDNVLRKPGKLTAEEYEHIKTHTEIGFKILSDIRQLDEVLPVVLHHHEQWDGRGYPRGLSGDTIPYLARIVAVADSYDAMGSNRPYRQGLDDAQVDNILRQGSGKQWDSDVVAAFFRVRESIRQIAREKDNGPKLDFGGKQAAPG